jgi:DNA gyrase/topoisomerase IV subunit A
MANINAPVSTGITGYLAVDVRVLQSVMMKMKHLEVENASLKQENRQLKSDHQVLANALQEAHRRDKAFKQQLVKVKREVDSIRESQTILNETNKCLLSEMLAGMSPDSDSDDCDPLPSATYTMTVSRRQYRRMIQAYITVCMYAK